MNRPQHNRIVFLPGLLMGMLVMYTVSLQAEKVIAHRGASAEAPENTLASFNRAMGYGADWIELDLRQSKDDSLMVIHDETINRTTNGEGRVSDLTWAELQQFSAGYPDRFGNKFGNEHIPVLLQVLMLARGNCQVCIDLKNAGERLVIDLVRNAGMIGEVALLSYNPEKIARIRQMDPGVRLILATNNLTEADLIIAQKYGCFAIATSSLLNPLLVERLKSLGMGCWAGIVNDPVKGEQLYRMGVTGIMTDRPEWMTLLSGPALQANPNPFTSELSVSIPAMESAERLVITGYHGACLVDIPGPVTLPFHWRPSRMVPGIYVVIVTAGKRSYTEKVLFSGP
ncbi:MAG: glycerophosphodiester phosphodiesterase family protein [Bacteroidales bacterium]|nr:glycerophosphodiester phosphodiesterase family protein [Bacteroidales bacterium]